MCILPPNEDNCLSHPVLQILAIGRRCSEAEESGESTDGISAQVDNEIGRIRDLPANKMLPVYKRENIQKCWNFMTKQEGIKLNGLNVPCEFGG